MKVTLENLPEFDTEVYAGDLLIIDGEPCIFAKMRPAENKVVSLQRGGAWVSTKNYPENTKVSTLKKDLPVSHIQRIPSDRVHLHIEVLGRKSPEECIEEIKSKLGAGLKP